MKRTRKALKVLLRLTSKAIVSKKDGKISLWEWIRIIWAAFGLIGIRRNIRAIGAEIMEMHTFPKEERDRIKAEIVREFIAEFDLPDDQMEKKIEQGFEMLAEMAL